MTNIIDITIPDIGDTENVEVIEVLVAVGQRVAFEDSLITVESDKASMEIPAPVAGEVTALSVSVGDQVKAGDVIGQLAVAAQPNQAETSVDAMPTTDTDVAQSTAAPEQSFDAIATATIDLGPESDAPAATADGRGGGGDNAAAPDKTQRVTVVVPDIGDVTDVEVIEILVSSGDAIAVDESLITVEGDKASMEIPSPAAGIIEKISVSIGDRISEGDTVLSIQASAGSIIDDAATGSEHKSAAAAAPSPEPSQSTANAKEANAATAPAAGAKTRSSSTESTSRNASSPSKSKSPTAHLDKEIAPRVHASPGVRRYARELGADLTLISGTGPKQRILKEDVRQFIKHSMESVGANYGSSNTAASSAIPVLPEIDFSRFGDIERVPLGRINKLSASNLHRAWLNVPMVTHHDEADITAMESFRKELKSEQREGQPKITGLAFHMKALVHTLKAYPKLNASMSPDGEALIYKQYYHIGIAVDTANGLVVPVFRDVDKKSVSELAAEMAEVSERARAKKLKPDEMQGASMTISSLGGIGGTAFTPIVNSPEVAILGIARARMQPVWNGSDFEPRLMCPLDLTYDHRVVDGADAARFMVYYCKTVSDIRRLLL